jgi:DNA-binding Lrp family transcriptional regulator
LNLEHQAKAEAILILREDFALTWSAIAERMGMSEGAIRHLLNQI